MNTSRMEYDFSMEKTLKLSNKDHIFRSYVF